MEELKKELEKYFTRDATEITSCPKRLLTGNPQELWVWILNNFTPKVSRVELPVILQGEPLPCPFCGDAPEYNKQNSLIQQKQMWQIYCDSGRCEIKPKTDLYKYKKECLADWNKRAGREPQSK